MKADDAPGRAAASSAGMTSSTPKPWTDLASPWRCVSIDVEDYFHIEAAHGTIGKDQWDAWPARVDRNVDKLLQCFDRHNRRGTFFILGDVAKRHPRLAKKIADAGHEIASHGSGHDRLHRLNARSFAEDLAQSKAILQDQTQQPVVGYRAPTFSLVPETAWAIDVLLEQGFAYDASVFPVRHPWYGVPDAPLTPFWLSPDRASRSRILELPPLVWQVGARHVPVAGGGYFRLLPAIFMKRGLRQAAARSRPAVLYFHPWEFDPDMPRMPLKRTSRIRTYTGLKTALKRLDQLLADDTLPWVRLADQLAPCRRMADAQPAYALR